VGGIAKVMARNSTDHADLLDAFLLLTESLAELGAPPPSQKQQRIERLAQIEAELGERTPAERMGAVMRELGIKRSRYFELRAAAIEQQLLTQSGESGNPDGLSDCVATAVECLLNVEPGAAHER
jgi:hypothetical protein